MTDPKWLADWQSFQANTDRNEVALPENLRRRLHYDLNPTTWQVFNRLFVVHLLCSLFVISICPQLSVEIFEPSGLSDLLLSLGEEVAHFLYGVIFMGTSVLAIALLFSPEQKRVMIVKSWWLLPLFVFASFGVLNFLGDENLSILSGLWIGGALFTTFGFRRIFAARL